MPRSYRAEYERLLPLVEKPARYLGNERGSVRKPLDRVAVRFCLAFPEVYEIAQSHLGLQILYGILNQRDDVAAERAYAPWPDLERLLRARGLPLVTLESQVALADFHIIGFSLQYELTYTNLVTMLELGGIPIRAAARTAAHPIVIAGGPCAFNPEPIAPFLDAVVLGDGEALVGEIATVVGAWDRRDRGTVLQALADLPGVYVPAFFEPRYHDDGTIAEVVSRDPSRPTVAKRVLPDLNAFPPPAYPIVPNVEVVHDRAAVEVMRGCVKGCRFCQAGYIYRPLRERNPEQVVSHTMELIRRTGYEEVSLLSLSTGDYSGVNPVLKALMDRLTPERIAVSLPSTRVDALSPRILEQVRRVRKSGFTLAPEAGTQRLRDVIQKEYREDELLEAARLFGELGWRSLKLYFMIGLPSETEEDVRGIAILAERVKKAAGGQLKVTASVSTFSPKPHTPFQWAAELPIPETLARQSLLRSELRRRGVEFKWHDPTLTHLEGVFGRGDRRLADVIETAQRAGARFDGWSDHCRFDLWKEALATHGLAADFYLRRRPLSEVLPWEHLDAGVSRKWLQRELARAVEGQLTPDCSVERCTYCGACDFEAIRNVDYHAEGAKGSDHRGAQVSRWAELLVPPDDEPGAGWETRTFRAIRARVAQRGTAARPRTTALVESPLPTTVAGTLPYAAVRGGEGNAEEWLGAVPSALAPDDAPAPSVAHVRVRYRKVGPARFLGGRELGTVIARAARRAEIPVAFSQGHHPQPRIAFGPALPVGTSSDDEHLDIALTRPIDPETLRAGLAAELPEGLEPTAAWSIERSEPSIDASTFAATFDVDLSTLDTPPSADVLTRAVAAFHGAPTFAVPKRTKGGTIKSIDARACVHRLEVVGDTNLRLDVDQRPGASIKPAAVVGTLLGLSADETACLRIHKRETRLRAPSTLSVPVAASGAMPSAVPV